jgi:hypothetical protein
MTFPFFSSARERARRLPLETTGDRIMKLRIGVATALCCALVARAPAQDAPRVSKTVDVDRLTRVASNFERIPAVAPLSASLSGAAFGADLRNDFALSDADFLSAIASEEGDGDLSFDVDGSRIRIAGERARVDHAAALLSEIRSAIAGDVRVRLAIVETRPEKLRMNAVEAAAFFKSARVLHEASTNVRGAFGSLLRSGRELTFVSGYESEVAQKMAIADPKVSRVPLGLTARVSAGGLPDGRLLLRAGGVYSTLRSLVDLPAGDVVHFGDAQRPTIASTAASGAAILESGGAFVFGGGPGGYWVAQAVRGTPWTPNADPRAADCSGLLAQGGVLPASFIPPAFESDGPGLDVSDRDEPAPPIAADRFIEALRQRAQVDFGGASLTQSGGLVLLGDADQRRRLSEAATAIAAESLKTLTIDVRFGAVDVEAARALVESGKGAEDLSGRTSTVVPCGERFRVLDGVERTTIVDGDVEIAQEAAIVRPQTAAIFEGFVLEGAGSIDEVGTGSALLRFVMRRAPDGPGKAPRLPNSAVVETQNFEELRFDGPVASRGEWTCLGTATAHDGVFVVMVRLTP